MFKKKWFQLNVDVVYLNPSTLININALGFTKV